MPYKTQKEQNDYVREIWYPQNRAKHIEAVRCRRKRYRTEFAKLKSHPCMDCNKRYPYYAMDWDHVRGSKEFNVSRGILNYWNRAKILKEIAKCDLVCANCHRIRTFKRSLNAG